MTGFKARLRKTVIRFSLLFLIMFILRLIYGFIAFPNNEVISAGPSGNDNHSSILGLINIASNRYEYKKGTSSSSAEPQTISVQQKYEKTATVRCKTTAFEEDETSLKASIENINGIIQFQQKSGNEGSRRLQLQIGIPPADFETFVEDIKANYSIESITITKTDKTNEYRELNAKLATLTATRASLISLKAKGGKIEEFIDLENRILEIDEQLQNLGVQLGNFDSENEFCTVKLSLQEGQLRTFTLSSRLLAAFEWTVKYYLYIMLALFLTLGVSYLMLRIADRLRIVERIKERLEE